MIDMQKYPKGLIELKGFVRTLLQAFQDSMIEQLGGETSLIEDDYIDQVINPILTDNPRILYDFFDERDIFIGVYKKTFRWVYFTGEHDIVGGTDRKETEMKAFDKAFAELELKLQ